MNYQFPKKEYNEEKYSKYLTELGFRELTQQDADRLQGDYNGYEINYRDYMENPQNYNFKTFLTFDEYLKENEGGNWNTFVADTGLLIDEFSEI